MKWTEVKVKTASEAVEAISNLLMELGASGVAIEDPLDIVNFQKDAYGEVLDLSAFDLTQEPTVAAYFSEKVFVPELLPSLREKILQLPSYGLAIGSHEILLSEVKEANWEEAWKKYYHPVRISRYLTIVPDWEDYQGTTDEKIITLDPGMAFGTGTHPTTRLTLQAIEMVMQGGETVYDVGTGSGVLSIACKHFGASEVTAFDLDSVAVNKAQENMALNPVAQDVVVKANDLLKGVTAPVDLIVANILADIIIRMLPDAVGLLKEHGHLVLSGIILDKEESVLEELAACNLVVVEKLQQGDWLALIVAAKEE